MPESALRRTKKANSGWVLARKITQAVSLIIFVALLIASRRGGGSPALVNLPMRLDPLITLSNLLSSKTFLAGSSLSLILILLSLLFGRAWCGWLCPMGTVLDWFSLDKLRGKRSLPSENWRSVKYFLLITTLVAALLGNLTLLIFDPLTILFRSLTLSFWPALDRVITALERLLYPLPILSAPISSLESWLRPTIFPTQPTSFSSAVLFALVFFGVIALNLFAQRFWCRYLCPLGGFLGLISKFALFRRVVGEDCKNCGLCESACPTGTIEPDRAYQSDPSECTLCLECLRQCPRSSIRLTPNIKPSAWRSYDPSRRQVLAALTTALVGVSLFASNNRRRLPHPHRIQPPGAQSNDLLSKCVRCGECMRACPTAGLQPSITETGLEGLWTPILVPRSGYCDFSCNACGQVCPVQAIPPLNLDTKRQTVIGKAYIDQNHCIAWADHKDCIVCEEMCPLPEKAIKLEPAQFKQADGSFVTVKLPQVNRQTCIGCGICEFKCPLPGPAAIRVFITDTSAIG